MKYKGEKTYIYRIDFTTVDNDDWGFEYIEAHTTDEAIEIFRAYYDKTRYKITDVLKRIGKASGIDAWEGR